MNVKKLILLFLAIFSGCYYFQKQQFFLEDHEKWDYRDCLTIIASSNLNNYNDYRTNIKVSITPYTPKVIFALEKIRYFLKKGNELENVNSLLKETSGLYVNWENYKLIDGKGNYFRSVKQLDSLLFLITITNKAWNSINSNSVVSIGGVPVVVPLISFDNCYIPDISNLNEQIYIQNGVKKIKPKIIWGQKNKLLTTEETLLIMFNFDNVNNNLELVIDGFEQKIKFNLNLNELL